MRVRMVAAWILVTLSCALRAADTAEVREHTALSDSAGRPLYTVTSITRVDDPVTRSEQFALIRDDKTNEMWVLHSIEDYGAKQLLHEVSDIKRETYLRVTRKLEKINESGDDATKEARKRLAALPLRIETSVLLALHPTPSGRIPRTHVRGDRSCGAQ